MWSSRRGVKSEFLRGIAKEKSSLNSYFQNCFVWLIEGALTKMPKMTYKNEKKFVMAHQNCILNSNPPNSELKNEGVLQVNLEPSVKGCEHWVCSQLRPSKAS